jgi:hypothetical protein
MDHEGIRIFMTNERREVGLKYRINDDPGIQETKVFFEDTPGLLLDRLGLKGNWHVVDREGRQFPDNDALYTFATGLDAHEVNLRQGTKLALKKGRSTRKPEDEREGVMVQFGPQTQEFARNVHHTYQETLVAARSALGLPETWQIITIRAEEDRIVIICAEGGTLFWFTEKECPHLNTFKDGLREAARKVTPGMWTVKKPILAPPLTIQTRSEKAAPKLKKVILQLGPSGDRDSGVLRRCDPVVPFGERLAEQLEIDSSKS